MKCNSTLRNLFALTIALTASLYAKSAVYVDNGSYNSYNLAPGDSLIIRTGVYQGYIGQFDAGAKITVAAGASFQPSGINNPRGTIKNLGTVRFNGWIGTNGGFSVENYGNMSFAQGMPLNEGPQTWINYYGATLRFEGGVTINGSSVTNRGILISNGDITLNSNATLTNNNSIQSTGTLSVNGSTFNNSGKFKARAAAFNSGAILNNVCGLAIDGPISNSSDKIYNSGLLWSTVVNGNSKINNYGVITNYDNGTIKSVDFYNSGTLSGTGSWYFTGYTENYGTVGINGGGSDKMNIYDATRTNSSQIFDVQYGNVRSSARFTSLAAPDTAGTRTSCASESRNVTLPVKWEAFTVVLSNNIPLLNWTSEQTSETVFNIERSYDASSFTSIGSVSSKEGLKSYKFEDKQININNRSAYYRIRAVEADGTVTISETRALSFANKAGITVQAAPNPFTSQLNISYNSTVREKISLRIVSLNGAVMVNRAVNVTTGYNTIQVSEAASLTKGMYLVQLISENMVIASERIVKQ